MIQQLRNAVVAPTGMGKNYGRIMPLLLDKKNCYLLVQELHNLRSTTHWSAKKLCNGKGGVPRLKCLKNGLRNC